MFRIPYFTKVALVLFVALITFGGIAVTLFLVFNQYNEQQITQTLHASLAQKIINDNPGLQSGEITSENLEHAFHNMMILGPSFEFYFLSETGQVETFAKNENPVLRHSVPIQPIKDFLSQQSPFPIKAIDPRAQKGEKVFSVAPVRVNDTIKGYLFIVIGGKQYEGVFAHFNDRHQLKLVALVLLLGLLFSFMIAMLALIKIFKPLRRLNEDMQRFNQEGLESSMIRLYPWPKDSTDDVEQLGHIFNQLLIRLKNQYTKIKSADEMRRELVSYVSHDLRTPLTALKGYLETWLLKNNNAHFIDTRIIERDLIEGALNNAKQMEKLVEQLFELAHLEGEQVKLNHEVIPVAELAQDVIQKLSLEASKSNITLDITPKDPSILVKADIQKLERALTNLIENAIRHTDTGGKIQIKFELQDTTVSIEVEDNGCGIPEDEISQVFEPHFRASNSHLSASGIGKGLGGLGLAITQRIIQLHGSQIEVLSEVGKGSAFKFKLPQDHYEQCILTHSTHRRAG